MIRGSLLPREVFKSPTYGFQRFVERCSGLSRNILVAVFKVLCCFDFWIAFETFGTEVAVVTVSPAPAVDAVVEESPPFVEVV